MIKKNIWRLILTSAVTLLPAAAGLILWNRLPEAIATHWNAAGEADGFSGRAFAVFGIPLILLAFHWVCVLITAADPKNKGQNSKIFGVVLWIIPTLSLVLAVIMYSIALGIEFDISKIMPIMVGVMFIVLGNYMPKCKQNNTIGIKIPWTLADEENWNRTHRLAGKLWVAGGIALIMTVFLPTEWIPAVLVSVMAVLVIIPTVYSYNLHRKKNQ